MVGLSSSPVDPRVLSAPWTVATTTGDLIADGRLQSNLLTSTQRAVVGLGLGVLLGTVLALIDPAVRPPERRRPDRGGEQRQIR